MTTPEHDEVVARWVAAQLRHAPALTPEQADRVSALLGIGPEPAGQARPRARRPSTTSSSPAKHDLELAGQARMTNQPKERTA